MEGYGILQLVANRNQAGEKVSTGRKGSFTTTADNCIQIVSNYLDMGKRGGKRVSMSVVRSL